MNNRVKKMTVSAMLAAVAFVLGYFSISTPAIKITFETFPLYVGSMLFGPGVGGTIALVYTTMDQLLGHGITPTTLLWMAPKIVAGLFVGFYAKKRNYRMGRVEMMILLVVGELISTICNTFTLYVDGNLYGYYNPAVFQAMLVPRFLLAIGKGLVFGWLMAPLLKSLRLGLKLD